MQCLKCGNDTAAEQVFCDECLASMEEYPVKPGTPVLLPPRASGHSAKKAPAKRTVPLELQLRRLKGLNQILICVTALALLFSFALAYVVRSLQEAGEETFQPGQNYSAIEEEPTLPVEWIPIPTE